MSASVSAMRGGQPSTTQPIEGPWLSPKVVTRKRWPKVLNDIGFHHVTCGSPQAGRGQMAANTRTRAAKAARILGVARQPAVGEHVDDAMVDSVMRGILRRRDRQMGDQRPARAAGGGDHGVLV